MPRRLTLTNRIFGELKVLGFAGKQGKSSQWRCLCSCGNEVTVLGSNLMSANTKSCGCIKSMGISATPDEGAVADA